MLTSYIKSALRHARYEILADDGSFYGEIPGFQAVYAHASTLEACRDELEEVLEGWILLRVSRNLPLQQSMGYADHRESRVVPRFGPIRRSELIRHFRRLGFDGPYSGRKHQFMAKGEATVRLQIRMRAISERIVSLEARDKLG
jgi:predicted RNase H-like HicB family nuclease